MSAWPLGIVVASVLGSGCAAYSERPNPWLDLDTEFGPPAPALAYPDWPAFEVDGERAVLTADGLRRLAELRELAEGNRAIAEAHAAELALLEAAYADLVRAGRAEHALAESRGRMLEEERRARLWDKVLYGAVAVLGLLVGLN